MCHAFLILHSACEKMDARMEVERRAFYNCFHIDYSNCHLICWIVLHSTLTIFHAFLLIVVIVPCLICIYGVTIKYLCSHEMLTC